MGIAEIDRDITLAELEAEKEPFGRNDLGSHAMFIEREKYHEEVYPTVVSATPWDLWYDTSKSYLGKIDSEKNPFFVRQKYLKQIKSEVSDDVWALDFVADAFKDFKEKFTFFNQYNVDNTPFQFLEPYNAWTNVTVDYNNYLSPVFETFVHDFMTSNQRDPKLLDFKSFLKLFMKFLSYSEGNIPLTLSKFILSPYSSPTASGLMIELANHSYGDDAAKYNDFIKNICFECYVKTAAQHGFKIDKNYPARLIADIKSPAMQRYMAVYPMRVSDPPVMELPIEPVYRNEVPSRGYDVRSEKTPWRVGDLVQIAIINPHDKSNRSFILSGYTLPRFQVFAVGAKANIVELDNGQHVDEFNFLVEYFEGYGELVLLTLKIDNLSNVSLPAFAVDPTEERLQWLLYDESGTPFSPPGSNILLTSIINALKINPNGDVEPMLIEKSLPGTAFESGGYIARGRMAFSAFNLQTYNSIKNEPVMGYDASGAPITQESAGTVSHTTVAQSGVGPEYEYRQIWESGTEYKYTLSVPHNSIHLLQNSGNKTEVIDRFNEFYTAGAKEKIYQDKLFNFKTFTWPALQAQYNKELKIYEQLQAEYNIELEESQQPPISFSNLISRKYNLAYRVDVDLVKEICTELYFSFVSQRPQAFVRTLKACGDVPTRGATPLVLRTEVIDREKIWREKIDEEYSYEFWLGVYIGIRNYENPRRLNAVQLSDLTSQARFLYKTQSKESALNYINESFKFF